MKFRRAMLDEPHKISIYEVEESPSKGQVMLKVSGCGMCNWELEFWHGTLNWGYPQVLGHEFSGVVVEVGEGCTRLKVGDKVSSLHGLGGFSEYIAVDENTCELLEDDIDSKYSMGEPQKCIVTVLDAAKPQPADYGVIQGCGPMGIWCIQGLRGKYLSGLIAVDIDDAKLELAKRYGATHVINSKKVDAVEEIAKITKGHMADFAIEGTGIPALLNQAQDFVKSTGRGRLVLMSSHHSATPEFDFRKAIDRGLTIIAAHPNYSLNAMEDFRRAVSFINSKAFQSEELVTHEFTLDQIQEAFETLANKPQGFIKAIVVPNK